MLKPARGRGNLVINPQSGQERRSKSDVMIVLSVMYEAVLTAIWHAKLLMNYNYNGWEPLDTS
jgi:hypothetical protein